MSKTINDMTIGELVSSYKTADMMDAMHALAEALAQRSKRTSTVLVDAGFHTRASRYRKSKREAVGAIIEILQTV